MRIDFDVAGQAGSLHYYSMRRPGASPSNRHSRYARMYMDHLKQTQSLFKAAPKAEWVRSLNFSALNHSIISSL